MPKFHENFLLSRLKLRQLRLLTAIADEGTVLKGSQALNIAQPAATKSIKELEDALGVTSGHDDTIAFLLRAIDRLDSSAS